MEFRMAETFFRVTRSFWMHGQVQLFSHLIRIDDLRLIAPLFAAGRIEPTVDVMSPIVRAMTCDPPVPWALAVGWQLDLSGRHSVAYIV
jgi:hypothetical protein